MKYLVIGETIEIGTLPPEQAAAMIENQIIPSLEMMTHLERNGKVVGGGVYSGGKTGAVIIEAESNDEVDTILQEMPMWPMADWTIIPLTDFGKRAADARAMVEKTKATL